MKKTNHLKRKYIKRKKKNMAIDLRNASTFIETICNNPEHKHNPTHKIQMYGVKYKDHTVEITKDGGAYHARVDNGLPLLDADYHTMIEWVDNEISKKGRR